MINSLQDVPINPTPSQSGNDVVDGLINLGLPILIFLFLGITSIYYIRLIQKDHLDLKETVTWIIWNIFLLAISFYLIVIYLLEYFGIDAYNLLDQLAKYLGISNVGKQWLIFIMLFFIGFLYAKSFNHTIQLSKVKQRMDVLVRELAILKGKLYHTVDSTEAIETKNKLKEKQKSITQKSKKVITKKTKNEK